MNKPSSSSRSVVIALVAMVSGLVVALVLVEAVVRTFFDEPVQPRYVINPGYGVRANQANVRTRHYMPDEYDIAITTNSAGMRGTKEYPVERVPGKRRILMLGDSFAFGYGVNDDEVVSAVLEELLNERVPGSTEVINLAVSGFGQSEELVTWENKGRAYQPDVVVLFYFDNDIGNNAVSELYALGADGHLVRSADSYLPGSNMQQRLFAFPPTRWLFEHSQAWNLVRNRLSSLVQRSLLREQGLATFSDATAEATGLTRALVARLVEEIRAAGAQPVMVIIPEGRQITSNFPLTAGEAAAMDLPVLDGREFVTKADYYQRDSHWRAIGHRKTAERLAPLVEGLAP